MSSLDDRDRSDIGAFLELVEPPPGTQRRNWHALQVRMADGAARRRWWSKPALTITGLAAAAVAIGWWIRPTSIARMDGAHQSSSPHQREETTHLDAQARAEGRWPRVVPRRAELEVLTSPTPEGEDESQPTASSAPATTSLAAEAELMSEVRNALDERRYSAALDLLEDHRRRFTSPFMGEEAAAWTALALCGLGRQTQGREHAASFARAYPHSPHRTSVASICDDTGVSGTGGERGRKAE